MELNLSELYKKAVKLMEDDKKDYYTALEMALKESNPNITEQELFIQVDLLDTYSTNAVNF